jgi:hypothetical protein
MNAPIMCRYWTVILARRGVEVIFVRVRLTHPYSIWVGQQLFVTLHSGIKKALPVELFDAVAEFEHRNVGREKICPAYLARQLAAGE